MSNSFTIHIFSTTGDPQGLRIIKKTNWSGVGVVFSRESVAEAIKEDHAKSPGVYILVGDLAEETVYIGEADSVSVRLSQHRQKEDWSWGVFFVDSHGLGKTEVQFLESELVRIAQDTGSAILMNKNIPKKPNMSRQSQAAATVFLEELLSILPMIGIKAFSPSRNSSSSVVVKGNEREDLKVEITESWDTIVVPAKKEGFESVFLRQGCWFSIRINAREISKFKYIAAYQVAPTSAITHIAEISEIVPYQNSGKYLIKFKANPVELKNPIRLQQSTANSQPQSPRYTSYKKIMSSLTLQELWL